MKKLTVFVILILLNTGSFGQGFIQMDTIRAPSEVVAKIPGEINTTFCVDFTGDGKKDYICQLNPDTIDFTYQEIWLNSELEIVKTIRKYVMDYDFFWFVNIDNDPEPEIFSASGYSDGIDYCFYDQNLKTGKDEILFFFNPIIINENNLYWGYPWDIKDLKIKKDKASNIRIYCSTDHKIIRDGEISHPDWQKKFPAICFHGQSTQPDVEIREIGLFEWLPIEEIRTRVLK